MTESLPGIFREERYIDRATATVILGMIPCDPQGGNPIYSVMVPIMQMTQNGQQVPRTIPIDLKATTLAEAFAEAIATARDRAMEWINQENKKIQIASAQDQQALRIVRGDS